MTRRVIVVYTCKADTLVCKFLYQRVQCHYNVKGLSFVSARLALQPCVSVLMVLGIQEMTDF